MVGWNLAVHPAVDHGLFGSVSFFKDTASIQLIQFNKSLTPVVQHVKGGFKPGFTSLEIAFTALGMSSPFLFLAGTGTNLPEV
jgi:hypothetical protein